MTCDTPVSKTLHNSFNVLKMVAGGAPLASTLQAVAAICAQTRRDMRFGILLLENERLNLAADHNLSGEDQLVLNRLSSQPPTLALAHLKGHSSVYVKLLITPASELIGALVAFGLHQPFDEAALDRELNEVCWMATLAIEQKHLSEELAYRVHHDALTHLWNRVWMEEEIYRVLTFASRREASIGLAILGVDRFRIINDVLGSQVGNELLCQIAGRIASRMAPSFSLARGSGDEFMVLMPDVSAPEQVDLSSREFLRCFDECFQIGDHELAIKASIGSTIVKASACTVTELEGQAYTALRYAKKQDRGKVVAFDPSMIRVPPERLVMEQHLRFALQKREFEVYYQPQINLVSGRMVGAEALLRWKHPALGFISPAVFIPLAEEIGLIEEVGDWVLDQVIRQCQEWRKSGLSHIRVAVNVSALQFARVDFGTSIAQKLQSSQIEPSSLELEITESAIMTNFEHGLRQMNILRSLGVTLAIDDFGTGHSSLAYLQQLPIQRLKIDRMFVKEIATREDRPPLLASIVQMARALGLSSIAEGAETAEQVSALLALDCEEVQGFVFSKPLPANDFFEWAMRREPVQAETSCSAFCISV
ncbi:MAG: putative bifunctional diguanylate cyclase/phosphodiesterase [Bryobacteraceae bacterium]